MLALVGMNQQTSHMRTATLLCAAVLARVWGSDWASLRFVDRYGGLRRHGDTTVSMRYCRP